MRRTVILLCMLILCGTWAFSQADDIAPLRQAVEQVGTDVFGILTGEGLLLISGIKDGSRYIQLGDVFADLLVNRLLSGKKPVFTVVNQAVSPNARLRDARWVVSGSIYQSEAGSLVMIRLIDQSTQAVQKGWEFSFSRNVVDRLKSPSTLIAAVAIGDEYEGNNSSNLAVLLTKPGAVSNLSILPAGDEDWFEIDLSAISEEQENRRVIATFNTTGSTDTYMEVYDPSGSLLAEDDDRGLEYNARIDLTIIDLTIPLHIRVRGSGSDDHGNYNLNLTLTVHEFGEGEPNDTQDTAESLPVDNGELERTIEFVDDEDWYRIEASLVAGSTIILETSGDMDLVMYLFDQTGN